MQLRTDDQGRNALQLTIEQYYARTERSCFRFKDSRREDWDWLYLHFLIERRYVFRYGIGNDPHPGADRWLGGVEIAIGPHYFGPADFWSYEQSERFRISATTEAVLHNLALMDEFWRS